MTFEVEKQDRDNLAIYEDLERKKAAVVSQVTAWMGQATNLHASVTADKQAEVIALRSALISELQAALAV